MKRAALTMVALLFVLAICVGVLAMLQPAPVQYREIRVAGWFEQLRTGDTNALTAFRAMGTNAVPFLINRLHSEFSPAERWYVQFWEKLKPAWRTKLPPPPVRDEDVLLAMGLLSQLGPQAGAAVPAVCAVLIEPPPISAPTGGHMRFVKLPNRVVSGAVAAIYISAESIRDQAVHTLAAIGSDRPESVRAFLEVAAIPHSYFYLGALSAQADWSAATMEALPELVRATASPNQNVRSIALALLGKHALNERTALLALARASVTETGENANHAAAALGNATNQFELVVSALVASLGATNAGNSVATPIDAGPKPPKGFHGDAARALVRLHPRTPLVKHSLLVALAHAEPAVRAGAAHTVGELGKELAEAEPRLRELHTIETNLLARFHQAYAVLRLSGDVRLFMPHILSSLTAPSENSRWAALGLLERTGAGFEEVVPRLMELAEKESAERVRARIATVLGSLGKQAEPSLPMLRRMLLDQHIFVRDAAAGAIQRIETPRGR